MKNYDLDKIRNMSDIELENYLKNLANKTSSNCLKCGRTNCNYTISVRNKERLQSKKLCSLCGSCYSKFLRELNISDIMWD